MIKIMMKRNSIRLIDLLMKMKVISGKRRSFVNL